MTPDSGKFAILGRPRRIWAIGAIHGEVERLIALHEHIAARFRPGDRLVYLGNVIGRGPAISETIDEILDFRRAVLSLSGAMVADLVYLRGAQEEMWQKLLQLQFAPNPGEVLRWMLSQGVDQTLSCYGGRIQDGQAAARTGAVQLTRWTNSLRDAMRARHGHTNLYASLKRAAMTDSGGVLLVSAGLDVTRPLATQGDSFWWNAADFQRIDRPYEGYVRIVRGYDGGGGGVDVGEVTATLDGGCGRGGTLAAGLFEPDGGILDILEV